MRLKSARSLLSICGRRKLKKLLKPKEEKLLRGFRAKAKFRHFRGSMAYR